MARPLIAAGQSATWPELPAQAATADVTRTKSAVRDMRIDFLRGLFILQLCGSHFTWFSELAGYDSPLRFHGYWKLGFSSPAEFFVFFSGYILALVLNRSYERTGYLLATARCVQRAWQLYALNIVSMIFVIGGSTFLFRGVPALEKASGIGLLRAEGLSRIAEYLSFGRQLAFFEILRNYIFFIPLVPLAVLLVRWQPAALLTLSLGVWTANALGLVSVLHYGSFCPLAWQLIFFLGCYVGATIPLTEITFKRKGLQIAICLGLLASMTLLKVVYYSKTGGAEFPGTDKSEVGPLRMFHFLVMLWGVLLLVPRSEILQRFRISERIAAVGRTSLECFCLSNLLVYFGVEALTRTGTSIVAYCVLQAGVVLAILLCASTVEWFKSEPWRG